MILMTRTSEIVRVPEVSMIAAVRSDVHLCADDVIHVNALISPAAHDANHAERIARQDEAPRSLPAGAVIERF